MESLVQACETNLSIVIPQPVKDFLIIEIRHTRILVTAVALQAIVDRISARRGGASTSREDDDFHEYLDPQDRNFIRQLVIDCQKILQKTAALASTGTLRYAPVRILISITSASVFLLKAISIGGRTADLQVSLSILDDGISALKRCPADDMEFSSRYATLIEKYANRFRWNFKAPIRNVTGLQSHGQDGDQTDNFALPDAGTAQSGREPPSRETNTENIGHNLYEPFAVFDTGQNWWSQPFDPSIAPFPMNNDHFSLGLDLNALDFFWNIPG